MAIYTFHRLYPKRKTTFKIDRGGVVLRMMVWIFWLFKFDSIILHRISILGIGTNRVKTPRW